ncbi:MAG: PAS domain-containing protein [Anaerolineae bacterium]|nr:PAS domain-containing protein [Anaerolineae bacterium]
MTLVSRLLDVPTTGAEDARRRKLLNILLLGLLAIDTIAILITLLVFIFASVGEELELLLLVAGTSILFVGILVIYAINRYRSGPLASGLFLLLLTFVFTFSDVPYEVANGRSLFLFAVPIIMASVLLQPATSFALAAISSAIIAVLAIVEVDIVPNMPAIIGFFAVALVSWLSARSLEQALEDLRAINRELDQRVIERTQDLAEALTREQTESSKNQAILESIADGVIVFDNKGQAVVTNHAITGLLNRPIHAITGTDVVTLIGAETDDKERQKVIHFVRDKKYHSSPVKFEWGRKTLSVSFAAVRDEEGEATGTVVVFRDYSREAEVDRMKSAFVSMVSHELRTPLNAILGYSDMLEVEVDGPLTGDQHITVERVIANGRRMLGLVNNLLDQAQIEAGRLTPNPTTFDPHTLVEEVQSVMHVLATQKNLTLECTVADDVPDQVVNDQNRLQQILVNLVGNAVKFTNEGGIKIAVTRPDAAHWQLKVSDTGAGIPLSAQTYIFEPFRQVDEILTKRPQGTGLGLAIVKELVELLGGDIQLSSEVGAGSTFTITLPLTLELEAQAS